MVSDAGKATLALVSTIHHSMPRWEPDKGEKVAHMEGLRTKRAREAHIFPVIRCCLAPEPRCQKEGGSGQRPELSERRVWKPLEQ